MGSSKPFLILTLVIGLAVLLAVVLSRIDTTPESQKGDDIIFHSPTPVPSPSPSPTEENTAAVRKLRQEEAAQLYEALNDRVQGYSSITVQIRFELPRLAPDQIVESDLRFDARKPDRWLFEVIASTPKVREDPLTEWEIRPLRGTLFTGSKLLVAEHAEHRVFEEDLDDTEETLRSYLDKKRKKLEERFANPLFDLFFEIPFEERWREFIEAKAAAGSEGDETCVLFRVTSKEAARLSGNYLAEFFPSCPKTDELVALREDVFETATGELRRVSYQTVDGQPFLTQRYLKVEWNPEMPDNRFELKQPDPSTTVNITRILKRNQKLGLTWNEAKKRLEEGSLDWPTVRKMGEDAY